jgi:hypothetical protein
MDGDRYLFVNDIPSFLKEHTGLRLGMSTIKRMTSPGDGSGPKPDGFWGRRPVFKTATVLEWALARVGSGRPANSSNEKNAPPKRGKLRDLNDATDTRAHGREQ